MEKKDSGKQLSTVKDVRDVVKSRSEDAKFGAYVFASSILISHSFYFLCDRSLFTLIELSVIVLVIAFLLLTPRPPPEVKHLNGLIVIVVVVGILAVTRALVFRILESNVLWKSIVDGLCSLYVIVSMSGLILTMYRYKRALILEGPYRGYMAV